MNITAGVLGATGYAGAELVRLLLGHPHIQLAYAGSQSFAGKQISDVYGHFLGTDITLEDATPEEIAQRCDVAFLCLPHGTSMSIAPQLADLGVRVIDLSGDFRYTDLSIYEEWYGLTHTHPQLNDQAVYGLPEFYHSQIAAAQFIANPGCYTTCGILALAPLLQSGVIKTDGLIIDAKSGVTGAGRKSSLGFSFCEVSDNFKAYAVSGHRHTSEMEEQLSLLSGDSVQLHFTPHLLPVKRGILSTIYARLAEGADAEDIQKAYADAYSTQPYTHVLPAGQLPELKQVVGSNHCAIGYDIARRGDQLIIVSCLDNLLKGAAGQAVQNFNIMHGLSESAGLSPVGWYL